MQIHRVHSRTHISVKQPMALTIGSFDGVHKGHQQLLQAVVAAAAKRMAGVAVITYDNHPSEFFSPVAPTPLICTLEHKLELLAHQPVDHLLLYHFDQTFASQSAEAFLTHIMEVIPFCYLNMGYNGHIGSHREGGRELLTALGYKLDFEVEYLFPARYDGDIVSSTRVRELIQAGRLAQVEELLGRPYSIMAAPLPRETEAFNLSRRGVVLPPVSSAEETLTLSLTGLATPPEGHYEVEICCPEGKLKGHAFLDRALNRLVVSLARAVPLFDKVEVIFI